MTDYFFGGGDAGEKSSYQIRDGSNWKTPDDLPGAGDTVFGPGYPGMAAGSLTVASLHNLPVPAPGPDNPFNIAGASWVIGGSLTVLGDAEDISAGGSGSIHVMGTAITASAESSGTVTVDGAVTMGAATAGGTITAGSITHFVSARGGGSVSTGAITLDLTESFGGSIWITDAGSSVTGGNVTFTSTGGSVPFGSVSVSAGTLNISTLGFGNAADVDMDISVLSGGTATIGTLGLGVNAGSSDFFDVNGPGSHLVYGKALTIGTAGNGVFSVSGGANQTLGDILLGVQASSNGNISAYDASSILTVNNLIAADGSSNFAIDVSARGGGTIVVGGTTTVGKQATSRGSLEATSGGTLDLHGPLVFGAGQGSISVRETGSKLKLANGTVTLGATNQHQITVADKATLDAAGTTFKIGGTGTKSNGILSVQGYFNSTTRGAHATVLAMSVDGKALVSVVTGGELKITNDLSIGTTADSTNVRVDGVGSKLSAKNIIVGKETAKVDSCHDWTYTGTQGGFYADHNGYITVAKTLTLNDPSTYGGITLSNGASMDVGGDHGAKAGYARVSTGGLIKGHGYINSAKFLNYGTIEAYHGKLALIGDFSTASTGTVIIDDDATLDLRGAFYGTVRFNGDYATTLQLDSTKLYKSSGGNLTFTGKIANIKAGDTIECMPNTWGSLAKHAVAHSEMHGSDLVLRLDNNKTVTYHLSSAPSGVVFNMRQMPDNHLGITAQKANSKIVSGLDGNPTKNDYIDALINGWGAWKKGSTLTYYFADAGSVHNAITTHGETQLVQCDNPKVKTWSGTAMSAFKKALAAYSEVTGLKFIKAGSAASANLVFWSVPEIEKSTGDTVTSGLSEVPSDTPGGHLWLYFLNSVVNKATYLKPGGQGMKTMIHEIGHALGLAHPHDGGSEPDASTFPGVTGEKVPGLYKQNQTIFTVMSYNDGYDKWPTKSAVYGTQYGLGAYDIAALQVLYGKNHPNATGNTTYKLVKSDSEGWKAIYDTGGIDTITNAGNSQASIIDLREATLTKGYNGGGYASYSSGYIGGYTIAKGVTIENAIGGKGKDVLIGNSAKNTLTGGADSDSFVFVSQKDSAVGGSRDKITDFSHAQDDQIDLRQIDANTGTAGDQAFKYVGSAAFSHHAGELRFSGHILAGDVNGDGKADFEISVNASTLVGGSGGDFLL